VKRNYYLLILTILFYSCSSITLREGLSVNEKEDWLQTGRDEGKSNVSGTGFPFNPPFVEIWNFNAESGFYKNALAVSDGVLLAGCLNGDVIAVDLKNGSNAGKAYTKGKSCFSTPVILKNIIVMAFSGGEYNYIAGYDFMKGVFKWKNAIERIESSPVAKNDFIYYATLKGRIYKTEGGTGKKIWMKSFDYPFYNSPSICGDLMFTGDTKGTMFATEINSGEVRWKYKTNGGIYSDVSVIQDKIFFGSDDKFFYCMDTGGSLLWKKNLETKFLSSCTFYSGNVICSGINGKIFSLNINTGDISWEYATNGTRSASPVLRDDKIFIGSFDKNFYCIDANKGEVLWKYELDGRIRTSAVIWKNFILVACDDKSIYCFK
jgi:eukaryotic-like serine/threonine-protein kinase